jgi:hypothetical protein
MKRKFCLANFNALDTGVLKDLLVFILQKTTPLGALLLLLVDVPNKNVIRGHSKNTCSNGGRGGGVLQNDT